MERNPIKTIHETARGFEIFIYQIFHFLPPIQEPRAAGAGKMESDLAVLTWNVANGMCVCVTENFAYWSSMHYLFSSEVTTLIKCCRIQHEQTCTLLTASF